jgi:hypothetical protein
MRKKFIFTRDWSGQALSTGGIAVPQVMTQFKKGDIVEGVKRGDSRLDSGTIEFSSPKTAGRFYVSDRDNPLIPYNEPSQSAPAPIGKMTIKQAMPYVLGFVGIIAVLKITKVI